MKPLLVALATVLLVGCGAAPGSLDLARSTVARVSAPTADATLAAGAIDAFGFDLLRRLGTSGNGVASPASIAIALGMARAGARGETAAQMDAVLHGLASDDHSTWLNALDAALAGRTGTFKDAAGNSQSVTLRIANAPFAQRDEAWNPAFLDALAQRFGAGVRLVDYKTAVEPARKAINGWVSEQTEQRIRELLQPGILDDQTRLVLVNAIYLKAAWARPFPVAATQPAAFTPRGGSAVQVPTMHLSAELPYADGPGWKAVDLAYASGQLSMTLVLPDDLSAFVEGLDAEGWAAITAALAAREPLVDLAMPTFSIESKLDLKATLEGLGMPIAFEPDRADFSGMTAEDALFIAAVVHQANIDVDEKGTTASAATAVVMDRSSAPLDHVALTLDRPFLFALRDVPTGAIVFLGVVADPSARA